MVKCCKSRSVSPRLFTDREQHPEPVIGIKQHPRHMDVAQVACAHVLHGIHRLLSSLATRQGPVQVLMSLRCLPSLKRRSTRTHSPTVNIWQHLVATAVRRVVTTIGVVALQHPCRDLLLGFHQRNCQLLQPDLVDWATRKPFPLPSMREGKGRTRLTPNHDVPRDRLQPVPPSGVHCPLPGRYTIRHSLCDRPQLLRIVPPRRSLRASCARLHSLIATHHRCSTPSAFASLRTTRRRK